jgi:hypothetical protein
MPGLKTAVVDAGNGAIHPSTRNKLKPGADWSPGSCRRRHRSCEVPLSITAMIAIEMTAAGGIGDAWECCDAYAASGLGQNEKSSK